MSKQLTPIERIKNNLEAGKKEFAKALPPHISAERFTRVVMTSVINTPSLLKANVPSVLSAAMKAASDGLLPDNKEAAIVTYKNRDGQYIAQYQPMVAGILKKVRNSGELSSIAAHIVYANDDFEFYVDEKGEHLSHKPSIFSKDRGDMVGVYAIAVTKDGASYIEPMSMDQVEDIKKTSKSQKGPWAGPFKTEMIRKSAIKRLSKRLPMSTDLENTIEADNEFFEPEGLKSEPEVIKEKDVEPIPTKETGPAKLKDAIINYAPTTSKPQNEEPPI